MNLDAIYAFVRMPVVQVAAGVLGATGLYVVLRTVLRLRGIKLEGGKISPSLLVPMLLGDALFVAAAMVFFLAYT